MSLLSIGYVLTPFSMFINFCLVWPHMCTNLSSMIVWVKWVELERIWDNIIRIRWLSLEVQFHLIVFMFIWHSFPITQWSLSCPESTPCPSSKTKAFPLYGIVGLISSIPSLNLSTSDGYCMLFSNDPYFSMEFLSFLPFYSFIGIFVFSLDTSHALCISVIIILCSHLPSR